MAQVKKVWAKAPKSAARPYLTPGKLYFVGPEDNMGRFEITDDDGDTIYCRWRGCAHLGGRNWIRRVNVEQVQP